MGGKIDGKIYGQKKPYNLTKFKNTIKFEEISNKHTDDISSSTRPAKISIIIYLSTIKFQEYIPI